MRSIPLVSSVVNQQAQHQQAQLEREKPGLLSRVARQIASQGFYHRAEATVDSPMDKANLAEWAMLALGPTVRHFCSLRKMFSFP
jgi:hypothetical protein